MLGHDRADEKFRHGTVFFLLRRRAAIRKYPPPRRRQRCDRPGSGGIAATIFGGKAQGYASDGVVLFFVSVLFDMMNA
jgi:hypothetical protein